LQIVKELPKRNFNETYRIIVKAEQSKNSKYTCAFFALLHFLLVK